MRARFLPKGASVIAAIVFCALFAGVVASAASPSIFNRFLSGTLKGTASSGSHNNAAGIAQTESIVAKGLAMPLPARMFFMPQATDETIETFAANCTTAKSEFTTGDTVCAKASGFSVWPRKIYWVNPDGIIAFRDDVSAGSPSALRTINMRGVWRAYLVDGSDGSLRLSTPFNVSDPSNPAVDLSVINNAANSSVAAEGDIIYRVVVRNAGPDTAHNVQLTESAPNNATYVSSTSPAGITCSQDTSGSTCSIATLAPGDSLSFTFTYNVNSGTPVGTAIVNTATVAADNTTDELHQPDNEWEETVNVVTTSQATGGSGGGDTCTVGCPDDISQQANTEQNGQPGRVVHFSPPSGNEECGTVTTDVPNDSFFPVGITTVTATASTGETCSFTVEITPPPSGDAPTISCPADKTASADSSCQATVDVGTPTTTGTGVTVTAQRSDERPLTDSFPTGTTTITWTATNSSGTASCQQTVTVSDTTPPVIVAPAPSSASADANCEAVIPDLTASTTTSDNCGSVDPVNVIQEPEAGTVVGLGTYTITLTATDGAGNSTSATTTFTVNDTTAPVVSAPANITVSNDPGSCSATVNPGTATATDNCSGSVTATGTRSDGQSLSAPYPKGTTTITWSATDAHNNTGTATQTVTVNDTESPVVTVPANITVYLPLHSSATSMVVTFSVTATDNCPGVTLNVSPASGSTFNVGTTTVTATATDASGNTTTKTFTVTVLYNFSGFFSPVGNLPTLNVVNAGRAIPVKFSLSGNKGLSIFLANSPQSGLISCDASAPAVDLTDTVTAGGSSLSYDATSDQYNYVWKTESSWAGTCRQLVVTLNDGTQHVANFKFK